MVWPWPSNVPPKVGMGVKPLPLRLMSSVSTTVFPWDQLSRVHWTASSFRSSAVAMVMVPPSWFRARAGRTCPASSSTASSRHSSLFAVCFFILRLIVIRRVLLR